jgi:hypothetical protein
MWLNYLILIGKKQGSRPPIANQNLQITQKLVINDGDDTGLLALSFMNGHALALEINVPDVEGGVPPATVRSVSFFPSTSSFFGLVPFQNDCERCGLISQTALVALPPHLQPS